MKIVAEVQIIPIGVGVSLSPYVAQCERVLREAGLRPELHAFGTNVEGEWETVMGAVRSAIEAVHAMGVPRVSVALKIGSRTDREQSLSEKVRSVEEKR